jgi:mannose-6-phosphate isomerase-like protein (cupin superfamily)
MIKSYTGAWIDYPSISRSKREIIRRRTMEIKNIYKELDRVTPDEKAGIKVDRLTGDDNVSVFVAEIAEQKWVKPHYHQKGVEIYQILEGNGRMKVGKAEGPDKVAWESEFPVEKGDCFSIPEKTVHQLVNTGTVRLCALFICSPSHLSTDRFFVGD